jgi:hypothetical protein
LKISSREWFRLPKMGRDSFVDLMKAGVEYNKSLGFRIKDSADLPLVESVLKKTLGEEIIIALRCFVCGQSVECHSCNYKDVCVLGRFSLNCICDECMVKEDSLTLYLGSFLLKEEQVNS